MDSAEQSRAVLLGRGVILEYFTIGYNSAEAVIAVLAGFAAGSIALVGFGFDSLIEIAAGGTVLWRLKREMKVGGAITDEEHSGLERRALLVIGITFLALAIYILAEAAWKLYTGSQTEESMVGIVLAIASLIVMPALALGKQRVARSLGSRSLASDAVETWMCSYLSVVLLAGLALNSAFGWSWADPIAALAMLPLVVREGWEALEASREEEFEDDD